MTALYAVCAVIGGTVMLCQFVMTLIGMGHADMPDDVHVDFGHADVPSHDGDTDSHDSSSDHAHSSTWFFGVITFRTIVAALTFFGLAGLAAESSEVTSFNSLIVALLAGGAALYGVHWMMQALYRLRAEGNVRLERAVGHTGSVYLRIPGEHSGAGKVVLNLQNRTVEVLAQTSHAALPTGANIIVTRIINADTVEVEPAPASEGALNA